MNHTNATRLGLAAIAVGAAIGAAVVGAPSAAAVPSDSPICERHVEYLDRPFGIKHIPGPDYEIYVTACAVGPGNGGPDEVVVPLP